MSALISLVACPNCTAPLSVDGTRRSVICVYCNTSSLVQRQSSSGLSTHGTNGEVSLSVQEVSKEDIERIKQLLIDGKGAEATSHYQRVSGLSEPEAKQAVDAVLITELWKLLQHVPLSVVGIGLYVVTIGLGAVVAVWATVHAVTSSPGYAVLAFVAAALSVLSLARFLRHLRSTITASFGRTGRGKVLNAAVLRHQGRGSLTMVVFEVAPDDGTLPFVDQEMLYLSEESAKKLVPGNGVRVRFRRAPDRVFPTSPVTLI
jgi:hypothetical protein